MRARLPLVVFILLLVVALLLLGFACACLSDHPMQAIERVLASIPAAPPAGEGQRQEWDQMWRVG